METKFLSTPIRRFLTLLLGGILLAGLFSTDGGFEQGLKFGDPPTAATMIERRLLWPSMVLGGIGSQVMGSIIIDQKGLIGELILMSLYLVLCVACSLIPRFWIAVGLALLWLASGIAEMASSLA